MCFPARIGMKCINDDLFLASLRVGQPFDSTSQKLFARHFPTYNQGTPLLTYLSRIVDHAMQYRFFVPPLQKLRPDALLGDWKEGDLPPWVELSARTTMPGILAGCLRSKTANLIMDPSYSAIVRSNENGYESFRSLASLCWSSSSECLRRPCYSAYATCRLRRCTTSLRLEAVSRPYRHGWCISFGSILHRLVPILPSPNGSLFLPLASESCNE